jgi:hypothetical protein
MAMENPIDVLLKFEQLIRPRCAKWRNQQFAYPKHHQIRVHFRLSANRPDLDRSARRWLAATHAVRKGRKKARS